MAVAVDDGEQVVEVVGDAGRETAHGFHLLRVAELLFEAALVLAAAALRHVAGDLRVTEELAGAGFADRGDHHVGQELGRIPAHPPALGRVPPLLRRRAEFAGRLAAGDVLGREEERVGQADDLGVGIAEDAFGPGVPADDRAVRIEHEDGVVGDALDEQAEPFVAERLIVALAAVRKTRERESRRRCQ